MLTFWPNCYWRLIIFIKRHDKKKKNLPRCARHIFPVTLLLTNQLSASSEHLLTYFLCENDNSLPIICKKDNMMHKNEGTSHQNVCRKTFKKPLFLKDGPLENLYFLQSLARRPAVIVFGYSDT
mgnify:CR=1 FL=1